jgi:hypothetical protein
VPLEANQTNQTKTTNKLTNAAVNEEIKNKSSGTLQPDTVNIGNKIVNTASTYDIKTMTRQTNTAYIAAGGDTPPNP